MKWDIDIGKDGRAEIPVPLIEERDGASFQYQHLFLDQKTIMPFFDFFFSHTKLVNYQNLYFFHSKKEQNINILCPLEGINTFE